MILAGLTGGGFKFHAKNFLPWKLLMKLDPELTEEESVNEVFLQEGILLKARI